MLQNLTERIAECVRLERGQQAEGDGLRAAALFPEPIPYASDSYIQGRYELGFRDGQSLLALAGPA